VWGVDGASKPAAVLRLCGHGGHAPHCLSVIEQGLCGRAAAQEMSRGGGKREPESTERINSFLVIDEPAGAPPPSSNVCFEFQRYGRCEPLSLAPSPSCTHAAPLTTLPVGVAACSCSKGDGCRFEHRKCVPPSGKQCLVRSGDGRVDAPVRSHRPFCTL
jgi:hypothetical protein